MTPTIRTLLFTDIEGSTDLLERAGDTYTQLLDRHRAIIRSAVGRHGGVEHGTEGDSFFVSFETATAALLTAIDAQQGLQAEPWPDGLDVPVRMGIHTGEVTGHTEGLVGLAIHHAARVAAAANGRQVIVSDATRGMLSKLPDGCHLVSRGHYRLRNVGVAELFEVRSPLLVDDSTPLRATSVKRTNVPESTSTLVGRDGALAELTEAVSSYRLVSLVGAGGVGKTSLALELCRRVAEEFDEGTWLVDLGVLPAGDTVFAQIASDLGVTAQPELDLAGSIVDWIGSRRMVIVLDNCEHVIDSVRTVVRLLTSDCPRAVVVTTTREPLDVAFERIHRVEPLDDEADATTLFVQRAHDLDHTFEPSNVERAVIGHICRHLDGVPLAIELAAARVRSMSVADIAERLDDRFRLLRGSAHGAADRHRTLRATLDWSYQLLGADERRVFQRLSIFSGSIDLVAAEAVCDNGDLDEDVVDIIQRLVDRSLVVRDRRSVTTRYRLLETMRDYAARLLREQDDITVWRGRHLRHFVDAAEHVDRIFASAAPEPGEQWFEDNWDNVRSALMWAVETNGFVDAQRLVVATTWFAYSRVRTEHVEWFAHLHALEDDVNAMATKALGLESYWYGGVLCDEPHSIELAQVGLARADLARPLDAVWCWWTIATTTTAGMETAKRRAYEELMAVLDVGDTLANDWRNFGAILDATAMGRTEADFARCLRVMRDVVRRVPAPGLRFTIEVYSGHQALSSVPPQTSSARTHYATALDVARTMRDPRSIGQALRALAIAAVSEASPDALSAGQEAVNALHALRYWEKLFQALESTVLTLARAGRLTDAAAVLATLDHEAPAGYGMETSLGFRNQARTLLAAAGCVWPTDREPLSREDIVELVQSITDSTDAARTV